MISFFLLSKAHACGHNLGHALGIFLLSFHFEDMVPFGLKKKKKQRKNGTLQYGQSSKQSQGHDLNLSTSCVNKRRCLLLDPSDSSHGCRVQHHPLSNFNMQEKKEQLANP
jgi:hypothetical protein